jgi:hypothetical protein
MKLSNIVRYRNHLDTINLDATRHRAMHELDAMQCTVVNSDLQVGNYTEQIQEKFAAANVAVDELGQVLQNLRDELDTMIQQQEPEYMAESTRLYEQDMVWETTEYILNRRMGMDDDSKDRLLAHIRNQTDWRVPGMIIRPGNEDFIQELVPLDPLYIVDHDMDLITPSIRRFNEVYQRRLRPYVITETDPEILGALPNNQFGFVFAYNFFNYKPFEVLQRYLSEIYNKLRPGGVFIMTFNDCDRGHGVALFESKFMCYTPRSRVANFAEQVGFDIAYNYTGLGNLSWIELTRPGKIISLRGGQPLAAIVSK